MVASVLSAPLGHSCALGTPGRAIGTAQALGVQFWIVLVCFGCDSGLHPLFFCAVPIYGFQIYTPPPRWDLEIEL